MKIKKITNQSGFTLLELLLYTSLMGIIVLAVSQFFTLILSSRIKNQTVAEVEQQGLQVSQVLGQTIRNAETITFPPEGGTAPQLTLDVPTVNDDPTIFDLGGTVLQIKKGQAVAAALTNSKVAVSALSFQNVSRTNSPGSIRYEYTITYINSSGRNEYNFSKVFYGSASLR